MKNCLALLLMLGVLPAWAAPKFDGSPIHGEVVESMKGGSYTYLRLKTSDGEVWAATMQTTMPKGTRVLLHDPMLMANFESKALGRTFDQIVFASAISTDSAGLSTPAQQMAAAHKDTAKGAAPVPVAKVAKAAGANGRTVAEVHAQKAQLANKPVEVRGTVVKFNTGIMDRNWVHLRDGTGTDANASNDLLLTTQQTVAVGDVVVASGKVKTNVDYGSGYTYPVLIEGATFKK